MTGHMHSLIEQLVEEALGGMELQDALADIWENKELFRIETFMELPEELRKYYIKTRRDTRLMGEGSSRYVYKIGPDRVIKIGLGEVGADQNKAEVDAELCGNEKYYAEVYEYADDYSWIISELAAPVPKAKLEALLGTDLHTLYDGLMSLIDQAHDVEEEEQIESEFTAYKRMRRSSWLRGLMDMVQNCDLEPADVVKPSSWGVRKNGKPILIDYGLGSATYDKHFNSGD